MVNLSSLDASRCTACGCPLGGDVQTHLHHVIPRAFGGEKGPTVALCTNDHNLLHNVALCLTGKRSHSDLVAGLVGTHKQNVMWLATRVAVAFEATKNDPNKRVQVSFILSAKKAAKLDSLMKIFNVGSRQAAVERLIHDAHSKHFLP